MRGTEDKETEDYSKRPDIVDTNVMDLVGYLQSIRIFFHRENKEGKVYQG